MSRRTVAALIALAGLLTAVVGVGMVYLPAAVILAGAGLILIGASGL